ncbi:MAG: aminotransferase class V-fold PLP-dependent enzyme [Actinomycetota bacterium]|nr:aminotransferase class V-fold PLP-dependent enzyme [Actinomycetota bacterium]
MIDIPAARSDTPGTAFVAHFNNAGASLMPRPVLETITGYLEEESRLGGYETASAHAEDLEAVYHTVARLIGADQSEIALADSATRAWDLAFTAMRFSEGDRILTTTSEYASNVIAFLQVAERTGVSVEVVPDRATGEIDVDALDAMIDDRVRLIAINHMPTNGGLVNPAADVGRVANEHGIPYLLDACQSVGQMPIDVEEIGCDLLSATSRKFLRGPRGAGFLYVSNEMLDRLSPAVLDLHGASWVAPDRYEMRADARRFELWERSPALILGMGRAAAYAMDIGLEAIWERVLELSEMLRRELAAVPGVTVRDIGSVQGAIVTFTVDGHTAGTVKAVLHEQAINVSVTTPYSARFDALARDLPNLVRASVHYFNTEDEIDQLVGTVAAL